MTGPLGLAALREMVRAHPGSTKRQLVRLARAGGHDIVSTEINRMLYGAPSAFHWEPGAGSDRLWFHRAAVAAVSTAVRATAELPTSGPLSKLYPWQKRALDAWLGRDSRGVVEAVTGAGKTRVAMAATYRALHAGKPIVTIVPTLDLANQWRTEFIANLGSYFPRLTIGQLGGGQTASVRTHDIVITTASSAASHVLIANGQEGLLIADECHHYGAEVWSAALEEAFDERLGLTATYEREDRGIETYLDPYFGGVCYSVEYGEALADDVIAKFKIGFVGVSFTPKEQAAYEVASEKVRKYKSKLVNGYGLSAEPFAEFMQQVSKLRATGVGESARIAGFFLSAFTKRRAILANAEAKLVLVARLAPAVKVAERTIIFAQTRAAAAAAVEVMSGEGVRGKVLDATMGLDERKLVFAGFEDGSHELVAAPKLLDEGIDVPAADLAIVLATSRSRRQMIQRMGRVIRKKADGRMARICVLYVTGTSEDPADGAHEDFINLIIDSAEDIRVFRHGAESRTVCEYLSPQTTGSAHTASPDKRIAV